MRKLVASVAVLAVAAIFVAPTLAQEQPKTTVTVKAKVTPNKAGTKKKPQPVKFSFDVSWSSEAGVEPPVITAATVFFPKDGVYNGGKYPKCSVSKLNRGGLKACPAHSIMGRANGTAFADTTITRPKVTFVNGGARNLCLYAQLTNPARVNACAPATITKLKGDPKWGYRMRITVPENLQNVAGVPIALSRFVGSVGLKPYAKDFITTTNCPKNKRWPFQVETEYLYSAGTTDSSTFGSTTACK